ncbi:hypothetical protein [Limnohabitans sp.]|uniref:hypothetical protein n=1 Tax=Limnohabitans sp. TaxID=1907725 RepID=UPI0038BCE7ED
MAWLDFLKNGDELTELLIEGHNPYGASLLKPTDVDQMKKHLQPAEQVRAYVLGRVAMAGRGLWLLTDQHLLISEQENGGQVHALHVGQLSHGACLKGKYGYTLRVTAAGKQFSVYGASAQMAAIFYQQLGQWVDCAAIEKPPTLDADDVAQVQHHFSHAASQLAQPSLAAA